MPWVWPYKAKKKKKKKKKNGISVFLTWFQVIFEQYIFYFIVDGETLIIIIR